MGSTPNNSILCNRCKCNVHQDDRYTHQCQAIYDERSNEITNKSLKSNQVKISENCTKLCNFCKKNIQTSEYQDHILCHNLSNENESNGVQEIVTQNGSRYKIVYSVNVRNGSSNRNSKNNRDKISVPSNNSNISNTPQRLDSSDNFGANSLQQLNSIRNITNLLRQCK